MPLFLLFRGARGRRAWMSGGLPRGTRVLGNRNKKCCVPHTVQSARPPGHPHCVTVSAQIWAADPLLCGSPSGLTKGARASGSALPSPRSRVCGSGPWGSKCPAPPSPPLTAGRGGHFRRGTANPCGHAHPSLGPRGGALGSPLQVAPQVPSGPSAEVTWLWIRGTEGAPAQVPPEP